jgi:glycosyltransferase involved in cell wall biosynthesis
MKIVSVMTGAGLGGAEFAAVELLDALVGRGNEAVMLSDRPDIARDTRVAVAPLALGPKLSARNYLSQAVRFPVARHSLREALAAQAPYDVLLLHYKKDQLLAATLPRRLRPAVAWAEWGPIPRQMRGGPGNWALRAAATQVRTVMAISAGTRDSLVEAGIAPAKVAVVPNALRVDELGFSPTGRERNREALGIPPEAFVVGCTSRFHPKKRLDVLIDAVLTLPSTAIHLVLAGTGETEAELRARAAPLGDRVHFLPTPGEHPNELFSAFDLCAFCPGPTEGSPTSVILGMLAGRTCVSTAPEGVAGLLGDGVGAVAVPVNDARATAACIEAYVADPERARREGGLAAERARARFAAPTVAALAEELLVGTRGRAGTHR